MTNSKPDPLDVFTAATTLALDVELRELGVAAGASGGSLLILEGPPATDRLRDRGPPFHRLTIVAAERDLSRAALIHTAVGLGWSQSSDGDDPLELTKDRFRLVVFAGKAGPSQAPPSFWSRLLDAAWSDSSPAGAGIFVPSDLHLAIYYAIGCGGTGIDALEAREDLARWGRAIGRPEAITAAAASVEAPDEVFAAIELAATGGPWPPPMPEPEPILKDAESRSLSRIRFRGLELEVPEEVFRPVAFTHAMTDVCIEAMDGFEAPIAVDVGTGSGAIALALASERPDATVHAIDSSPAAVRTASRNRDRLGLTNVHCHEGFLLDPVRASLANTATVVAAALPFVAPLVPHRQTRVPRGAFIGAGADGLVTARALATGAREVLAEGGELAIQIGAWQVERVAKLFSDSGLDMVSGLPAGDIAGLLRARRPTARARSNR